MTVAILSDTHIPDQATELPAKIRDHVTTADHVIHADDFGSAAAFASIRDKAPSLTAVYGNADPNDIALPAVAGIDIDGVQFVVTHGMVNHVKRAVYSSAGAVYNRDDWLDAIAATARARANNNGTVIGVGGHTHEVEDELHDGIRVINPGSATGIGPADGRKTLLLVEVDAGTADVTVIEA